MGKEEGRGTTLDLEGGYSLLASKSMGLDVGVTVRTMDATYAKNFFGITQAQSTASGLKVYKADGGALSSGVFVQGYYRINNNWTAFSRVNAAQLSGDAKDNPITQQKAQASVLLSINYTF